MRTARERARPGIGGREGVCDDQGGRVFRSWLGKDAGLQRKHREGRCEMEVRNGKKGCKRGESKKRQGPRDRVVKVMD